MLRQRCRQLVLCAFVAIAPAALPPEALNANKKILGGFFIAAHNKVHGFVTPRYFWETYARTTTQGSSFFIQGTLLTKPITVP